jgi:hypothetical protein
LTLYSYKSFVYFVEKFIKMMKTALPPVKNPEPRLIAKPSDRRAKMIPVDEMFSFLCPACDRMLSLANHLAGCEGPCPNCETQIVSADLSKGKQARRAGLVAPERRIAFSPPAGLRRSWKLLGRSTPPPAPAPEPLVQLKPLTLGKVAKMTELPPTIPESAVAEKLPLMERLRQPKMIRRARTAVVFLSIAATIAGYLLLRARG